MVKVGDRIRVHNRNRLDHAAEGRTGTVIGIARMGYGEMVRVNLDPLPNWKRDNLEDKWLIHPESIEVVEK